MKILVLMPLQEQSAYMAMGIYKNLPSKLKDKTFCMPSFMDYLVSTKIVPNWEYALFDTLLVAEKMAALDEDVIILGNTKKDYTFDAVFNFQDIDESLPYEDKFIDTMREKVKSEELLTNKVTNLYTQADSKLSLHNCLAAADFLAAYFDTDPRLDEIKQEYLKKLQDLKDGNK